MSTISEIRTALPTGTWRLDPVHSSVGFSVKHMVVATFRGGFRTFDVTLDDSGLRGTVDVTSIDVEDPNLNGHLQSPEFFDAERFPQLSFRSSQIALDGEDVTIHGDLTVKGTTLPVEIRGTVSGPGTHPFDNSTRIGLELETVIDRAAYGLDWNVPMPGGGVYVANDVKLKAELELVLAEEA